MHALLCPQNLLRYQLQLSGLCRPFLLGLRLKLKELVLRRIVHALERRERVARVTKLQRELFLALSQRVVETQRVLALRRAVLAQCLHVAGALVELALELLAALLEPPHGHLLVLQRRALSPVILELLAELAVLDVERLEPLSRRERRRESGDRVGRLVQRLVQRQKCRLCRLCPLRQAVHLLLERFQETAHHPLLLRRLRLFESSRALRELSAVASGGVLPLRNLEAFSVELRAPRLEPEISPAVESAAQARQRRVRRRGRGRRRCR
mmetsp:Transcript_3655/g.13051  ORF Transcript_3655/g.13051 Transcript_3655/m.13051 type:complete len:268 (+) Transcript_3655:87-890(+)